MANNICSTNPNQVAKWMYDQLKTGSYLYQNGAVNSIYSKFGKEFTYQNKNFNLAIRKDVLAAFKKLTGSSVIWERGERRWRLREEYDKPGRQQD